MLITVAGAEGDISMLNKIKGEIEKIAKESIKREVRDDAFKVSVRSGSKGDDMVIAVEILFPKG